MIIMFALFAFALLVTFLFAYDMGYSRGRIEEMRHGHDFKVTNIEDLRDL